ncbi:MAG TPA: peptidylprolyl isomerase [Longimicrobiaceae bacterium]|nr:peptidylprolyl isomerase [Longimicrobiaceae bacterium]
MRKRFALALLLLAAPALDAQDTIPAPRAGEEVVDRVVAVVGDTVLLLSDVQAEVDQLRAAGRPVPTDPQGQAALVRQIISSRVNEMVALQAAKAAGIQVQDHEVAPTVDQEISQIRQRFPSEADFRAALAQSGFTPEEFRAFRIEQNRARATVQRFIARRTGEAVKPPVTEEEIRSFFESQRSQMGTRPATISFEQVIVEPVPSDSARAAARRRAEEALEEVRKGTDFAVLAGRYSDEPGARERGGDLGWFKQGQMVRPFEEVAFALRPGDVSGIVETQFGYHIIKLEKVRGGERQARHILIRPEITDADRAKARERADSVAAAARAGASMADLAARYNTPDDQRSASDVPADRLPPAYAPALQGVTAGQVAGPFQVEGGANGAGWVVVRVTERREAGEYTLDEFREQIRESIQQQKIQEQILNELRQQTYIRISL